MNTIATLLVIAALIWLLHITRNATEYPEWFEEDVMWKDIEKQKKEDTK